jgi:hypothetical protein
MTSLQERTTTGSSRESLAGRAGRRAGYQVVVLIPAHNEAPVIAATIASLHRQTRPPDRIVVVADNCSDTTEDLSLPHGAEVVTTVANTARKAGALNQALRRILPDLEREDFVLAMDADSQLPPDWIRGARIQVPRTRGVLATRERPPSRPAGPGRTACYPRQAGTSPRPSVRAGPGPAASRGRSGRATDRRSSWRESSR